MKKYIALDIGGTSIKYGIVDEKGNVIFRNELPTEAHYGVEALLDKLKSIIRNLLKTYGQIQGIGISTAGVVDRKLGSIIYANSNLPGYTGTKLKEIMEDAFNIKTIVNNDVNAAALAEAWVGAGKQAENLFCMTIGTGIGGSVIINRKLYTGSNFSAGEIGYLHRTKGEDIYYEKKASTSAILNKVKRELKESDIDLNGKIFFEKDKAGEKEYSLAMNLWIEEICKGIADIVYILDPGIIIIGGGVSAQGDYLLYKIREGLAKFLYKPFLDKTQIVMAKCGNDAGLIGSVYEFVSE